MVDFANRHKDPVSLGIARSTATTDSRQHFAKDRAMNTPELPNNFLAAIFQSRPMEPTVAIEHALAASISDGVVIGTDGADLHHYEELGRCQSTIQQHPRPIRVKYWGGEDADAMYDRYEQQLRKVEWQGHTLYALNASWTTMCGGEQRQWIIAETEEIAESFLLDVARKTNDPGDSMLVFSDGYWGRSRQLYQSVQNSNFDDLILPEQLKAGIRSDFGQFLKARKQYEALQIPWRRGALFIGPPGNGKTHCLRALLRELSIPSLYVQSLQHRYYESEQLLKKVFDRARELRPCVLLFEDLDALVNEKNQSFFLNQLDGFEKNEGLIVLATTNHPERIDGAIIDRPSRFDRKYHFELPDEDQRRLFLQQWQSQLSEKAEWTNEVVARLAADTKDFSYAYLKELVVSSLLAWLDEPEEKFENCLVKQQQLLASQMRTPSD